MANLKNKILQALQNNKDLETILNDLSKNQENLLKNHSNPVFNNKDKNKILKQYTNLQNIGKALYRYNALNENNLESDSERADIENTVLKGGISYNKYVWHSENGEHTCEVCKSLDGQVFDFYDEVPECPHPNCKCTVEIIEEDESKPQTPNDDVEPCDCWDRIDDLVKETNVWQEEIESLISELNSIEEEDLKLLDEIKSFKQQIEIAQLELANIESCSDDCVAYLSGMAVNITDDKELEDTAKKIFSLTKESQQVYEIFLKHKHEMEETKDGMDKYYHAKANCTSAELGIVQGLWAIVLSIAKEVKDYYYKVFKLHNDFRDVAKDCLQDLRADWYGIQKAKEHGYCSDKVKDVYEDVFNE